MDLYIPLVSQARPNQPQRGSLSVHKFALGLVGSGLQDYTSHVTSPPQTVCVHVYVPRLYLLTIQCILGMLFLSFLAYYAFPFCCIFLDDHYYNSYCNSENCEENNNNNNNNKRAPKVQKNFQLRWVAVITKDTGLYSLGI